MTEKDLRPTRYLLTLRYATDFITEFFEQNPISQLSIIGTRDGLAINISPLSGNPTAHITALQTLRTEDPKGQPSLQNALEMARGALFHAPDHTTREVLILYGSLLSADPGDIHSTITTLVESRITVTVIGLAAQVAICRTLVERTNPSRPPVETYTVALNEQHYRELLMRATTPPATQTSDNESHSSLLMMGFPSRIVDPTPTLCACHSQPSTGGYLCSRCSTKVCALPTACPVCGLTLILSTHLARSYHHLFPLKNWREVSWAKAEASEQKNCFACLSAFPERANRHVGHGGAGNAGQNYESVALGPSKSKHNRSSRTAKVPQNQPQAGPSTGNKDGVSESGRYECETCGRFFCIDCDVFAHEVVHNCPGCQSREGELANVGVEENEVDAGGVDAGGLEAEGVEAAGIDAADGGDAMEVETA